VVITVVLAVVSVVSTAVAIRCSLRGRAAAPSEGVPAEVEARPAQISPHFTYNALNTIAELIRSEPAEARELLQDFADFTRYSSRTSGRLTSLAEELQNVDRYLTIAGAVHRGQLGVQLKIAPEVLAVVLPFLILQPLVENAVTHGVRPKPGGGTVRVTAVDAGTEVMVSVEDDGVGMDPTRLADLRDGGRTGLTTVDERMRAAFGPGYALVVETAEGAGTKVTLRFPK